MSLASLPEALLVPPVNCLLAACAGVMLKRYRFGRTLLWAGLATLLLLALPLVSGTLLASLEHGLPMQLANGPNPAAIVVLSGDEWETTAGGPGGASIFGVGSLTLERERAAATLARRTLLPVLVSGGSIHRGAPPLGTMMAESLRADFGIEVRWVEAASLDTWQNAAFSADILRQQGIGTVYVVTHAWHMRRALIAFRHAGLQAFAAPVGLDATPPFDLDHLVPHARSWLTSYYALHEWIGCAWYASRS